MAIGAHDKKILRDLAKCKAEIGNLPIQKETSDLWRKLNRLESVRPLVWINEIPWHELNAGGELTCQCEDKALHDLEYSLRTELYQWNHFRCDMVVEPVFYNGIVGGPGSSYADYGILEQVNRSVDGEDVGYIPIIHSEADADKIKTPRVWYDRQATEQKLLFHSELFDGILEVRTRGIVTQWHSPWDQMIHWYGIEQLYSDMYDRPQLVHRLLRNFMRALNEVVTQQEALGMLDIGNGNWRVGSGGLGITDQLPVSNPDGHRIQTGEQWGCATAQIFSEVSPAMHEEFALQYERPLLERFGLTYYGCCEPLHKKIDMLRSVRNLRKISMSPWINVDEASDKMAADYVFSFKPNPAHLAMSTLDAGLVRSYLEDVAKKTRRNRVEFILKDVTTVCNQAQRLDEWAGIAMDVARAQ